MEENSLLVQTSTQNKDNIHSTETEEEEERGWSMYLHNKLTPRAVILDGRSSLMQ